MINYLLPLQLSQFVALFIRSTMPICKKIRDWVLSGGTILISGAGALRTLRMTGVVFMLNIIFIEKLKEAIYYFTI